MSFKSVIAVCLALVVTACSSNPFMVTTSNCPAVAVLANSGTLTRFAGAERNADDVAFNASITGINTKCDEGKDVTLDMTFAIVASRGPAFQGGTVRVPYFVALMRDNHLITAKKIYEAELTFSEGSDRAAVREHVIQHFEDVAIARRYDYELIIGFQLTPDEITYNVLR